MKQFSPDVPHMQRALRLAALGRGNVEPNPMVGCVITKNDMIIGEGYHQSFGGPHAEPNALSACKESPQGATVYVTLEPCCHLNKKTPPCAPRLIAAGIARVVVGCLDPNPLVAGKGIAQLRSAGITVDEGLLCTQATQLNAPFFKRMKFHRPYVTLKWAQSADNKIAAAQGQRTQISNSASLQVVHKLRAASDAILVGINTVLIDDPLLTPRRVHCPRPLLRIILDKDLRLPETSRLAQSTDQGSVRIYCSETALQQQNVKVAALTTKGVEINPLPINATGALSLDHLLDNLGTANITHLLVEPGPTLAASFISQNLADRVWIIRSPHKIENPTAPSAANITYPSTGEINLEGDHLTEYLNPQSRAYYALDRSPELLNLY